MNTFLFKKYLLTTNNDMPEAKHNECDICPPRAIVYISFGRNIFLMRTIAELFLM